MAAGLPFGTAQRPPPVQSRPAGIRWRSRLQHLPYRLGHWRGSQTVCRPRPRADSFKSRNRSATEAFPGASRSGFRGGGWAKSQVHPTELGSVGDGLQFTWRRTSSSSSVEAAVGDEKPSRNKLLFADWPACGLTPATHACRPYGLAFIRFCYPALTRWANECRRYAASRLPGSKRGLGGRSVLALGLKVRAGAWAESRCWACAEGRCGACAESRCWACAESRCWACAEGRCWRSPKVRWAGGPRCPFRHGHESCMIPSCMLTKPWN